MFAGTGAKILLVFCSAFARPRPMLLLAFIATTLWFIEPIAPVNAQSSPLQQRMEDCFGKPAVDAQSACFLEVLQQLDDCKSKADKASLVKCFSDFAGLVGTSEKSSASLWTTKTEADRLDGAKTIVLGLTSTDQIKGSFGQSEGGALILRCSRNKTEAYIAWPEFLGIGRSIQVRSRVDKEPIATESWGASTDGKAAFAPNAVNFVKRLFGKGELVVSMEPYRGGPGTLSFPISGIESEIRPLREACKW